MLRQLQLPGLAGLSEHVPALARLLAAHGEERIAAVSLDLLGFPWSWAQTAGEINQIGAALAPEQGAKG